MSKWIEINSEGFIGWDNTMSQTIEINPWQVSALMYGVLNPPLTQVFLGDFSKWCSSLMLYPIARPIFDSETSGYLRVSNTIFKPNTFSEHLFGIDDTIYARDTIIPLSLGFTLGEYHYTRKYNDYRDFEPYTTVSVYLPYYGFVDISTKEIIDKYVQFRLYVDFKTGTAMYVIGVNDNSVSNENPPYIYGGNVDDTNTRIISTHNFQLGVEIPIGQVNVSDLKRNLFLGSLKGAVSIGSSLTPTVHRSVTQQAPSITKTTKTITARNKKGQFTARRKHTSEKVETKGDKVTESKSYGKPLSTTSSMLVDIASSMTIQPSIERLTTPWLGGATCQSIKIVIREAKILPVDSNYAHIYGLPLGEVKQLSQIYGYAEVSETHIEGNFGSITEEERSQIDGLLSSGVIFPNPPTT